MSNVPNYPCVVRRDFDPERRQRYFRAYIDGGHAVGPWKQTESEASAILADALQKMERCTWCDLPSGEVRGQLDAGFANGDKLMHPACRESAEAAGEWVNGERRTERHVVRVADTFWFWRVGASHIYGYDADHKMVASVNIWDAALHRPRIDLTRDAMVAEIARWYCEYRTDGGQTCAAIIPESWGECIKAAGHEGKHWDGVMTAWGEGE